MKLQSSIFSRVRAKRQAGMLVFLLLVWFQNSCTNYVELPFIDPNISNIFDVPNDPFPVQNGNDDGDFQLGNTRTPVMETMFDNLAWEGASFGDSNATQNVRMWQGMQPSPNCDHALPESGTFYFKDIYKGSFQRMEYLNAPGSLAFGAAQCLPGRGRHLIYPRYFSEFNGNLPNFHILTSHFMHEAHHIFADSSHPCVNGQNPEDIDQRMECDDAGRREREICDGAYGFGAYSLFMLAHFSRSQAIAANRLGQTDKVIDFLRHCTSSHLTAIDLESARCTNPLTNLYTRAVNCSIEPDTISFQSRSSQTKQILAAEERGVLQEANPAMLTLIDTIESHAVSGQATGQSLEISAATLTDALTNLNKFYYEDFMQDFLIKGKAMRAVAQGGESLVPAVTGILNNPDLQITGGTDGTMVRGRSLILLSHLNSPNATAIYDQILSTPAQSISLAEYIRVKYPIAAGIDPAVILRDPHRPSHVFINGDTVTFNDMGEKVLVADLYTRQCVANNTCSTDIPHVIEQVRLSSSRDVAEQVTAETLLLAGLRTKDSQMIEGALEQANITTEELYELMDKYYGISESKIKRSAKLVNFMKDLK